MPLNLIAPIYTSYAYRHNEAVIYTQQSINATNNIFLFSTITYPRRPNKHCWTIGYIEGNQYVFRSESADVGDPGSTEVFTTTFPLPLTCEMFVIPFPSPSLYLATPYSTPFIPTEPGQYGSRTIPLPDDNSTGDLGGDSFDFYPDTINSTSELAAPIPSIPLRGAQLSVRSNSPHKRGHQGSKEEMLSSSQGNGAAGACYWGSFSLDRGLDRSHQYLRQ